MAKAVISFGRYNPPTIGHSKLFDSMSALSQKNKADMKIFASHTQDKKKNPLSYKDKIKFLKWSFPKYKNNIVQTDSRTIFDVLVELVDSGYDDITLVVGQDRVNEFRKLVDVKRFNADNENKISNFKVVSAGDRDPDSDDAVEAMSASKLRDFAKNGDLKNFSRGVSDSLSKEAITSLFNLIRKGMQINNSEELHMKEEKESVIKSIYVLNKAGEKFNLKLVKCRKNNLVVLYVDDVQIDEFPTEKEAHEYGVMLVKDEFKDPGLDPNGNKSRMWQTFRKWFHTMDDEGE